jgi:hypothetical protein
MLFTIIDVLGQLGTSIAISNLKGVAGQKLRLRLLREACRGDLEILKTVIDFLNITPEEARAVFNCAVPLAQMKWLAEKYQISTDDAVLAFISACSSIGGAHTARWLAGRFQLDAWGPQALIKAIASGNLELVKWLIETYKITWDAIYKIEDNPLVIVNIPFVLQYMLSTHDIGRAVGFEAVQRACFEGKLHNAKDLEEFFRFTSNDVRRDNKILKYCTHLPRMTEWLLDTYYKDPPTN